jgi:hypothetical protein
MMEGPKMWFNRLLGVFFLILFGISGFVLPAMAINYYYEGPNDGEWKISANWYPPFGTYPDGDGDSAWINDNPGTNVNVYLHGNLSLNRLKVDMGDSLTFGSGLIFNLGGTAPLVTNNGAITLSPDTSCFQLEEGVTATFSGTGTVNMVTGSSFHGSTTALYINDSGHSIRGTGSIAANMENRGLIIADGPELHIYGNNKITQSATGTLTTAGPGSLLVGNDHYLYGGRVYPNGGEVRLDNVRVYNGTAFGPGKIVIGSYGASVVQLIGNFTTAADFTITGGATLSISNSGWITNSGKVLVESSGVTQLLVTDGDPGFRGTGSIILAGTDSRISRESEGHNFVQDVNHTIRGAGTIDVPIINIGTIIAENGTLVINQPIMWAPPSYGPGQIEVKNGGTLDVIATIQTGNLIMSPNGKLSVGTLGGIQLKGDYTFGQQNTDYWSWGSGRALQMIGSGAQQQFLEVGGRDYGLSAIGFSDNFNMPALILTGSGTYVNLVDNVDNGHRTSPEALYVESLSVFWGNTLNLNRVHLYTYLNGNIHRVTAGEGNLFGEGQIIDVSVNPGPRSIPGIVFPLLLN